MKEKIDYLMSRGYNYPKGWFMESPKRTTAMYFDELEKEVEEIAERNENILRQQISDTSTIYMSRYNSSMEEDLKSNKRLVMSRILAINEERK